MLEGVSYEWKKPEEYSTPAVVQASPATAGIAADSISARMIQPETKNFPEGRQYGVLAQAVEVVLPEVVKTDSIGDKAVNYAGIIPVLIEAIKEQQKLIEKQQMEIMEIKNSFH